MSDKEAFERGSGLSKREKTHLDEYDRPEREGEDGDGSGAGGKGGFTHHLADTRTTT